MTEELAHMDATAQAALVRDREASPLELVDAAIARIEKLNPELNAIITTLFEKARDRASSGELPEGPFRGVPFLLKDLDSPSAGDPFHCGMRFLKELNYCPKSGSYLVDKFDASGLITLGKTNTPELGLNVTTEPLAYGPSSNPWNTDHSTGGSSGGSAAAVAAGLVPLAHASDGGGSIRVPASECGLVGLKPTRGRVSLGPDYSEYWSGLVVSFVLSRSVRDSATMLDCVAGYMPGDPYTAPEPQQPFSQQVSIDPDQLKVGILATFPGGAEKLHEECETAALNAGRLLSSLGHDVEESHPRAFDEVNESIFHFTRLVGSWVAATLNEWQTVTGKTIGNDDVEAGTAMLADIGRTVSAAEFVATLEWISRYSRRMLSWWADGFDLLLTPTIATPPPRLGYLTESDGVEALTARIFGLIPFTRASNITGQPSISLPLHWSSEGLPVGVMLTAAHGREDLLLRVAAQLEKAAPWANRRPAVFA